MRKFALIFALLLSCCCEVYSQQFDHRMNMGSDKPVTLMSGLGSLHHPVSTSNPEAQRFFDQGLALVYAFNHDEAIRSFTRAAELDPKMAMAWWGVGLALGPNINLEVDREHEKAAYDAAQKAVALSAGASENERAYVEALAKRYSIDPNADLKKLDADFKQAMGNLVKAYPDDLDAATLYAESAMDLRPWKLWSIDGKAAPGTEEIVAVLESVLRRNPNHPGAIHYYIHAVEASPNPERALVYAPKLGSLMPGAAHLVHMPAHIFIRTGNYRAAADANERAAAVDEAYFRRGRSKGTFYPLSYYTHNLHFLAVANCMEGRFVDARRAAKRLDMFMQQHLEDAITMEPMMPMIELYMPTQLLVLVRFHRWQEILTLPEPDRRLPATRALWHFARGMSFASNNRIAKAEEELRLLQSAQQSLPREAMINFNKASDVLSLAEKFLNARIADAKGQSGSAIDSLQAAVQIEDQLAYDEPPAWYIFAREALGGALLRNRNYATAEQVFRDDLQRHRRSGRSLFGLMQSLKAQQKDYAAAMVQREFEDAWKNADTKLSIDVL